ncbi:MAG: pilus assembly protein N-terminal domain-containing protein [Negativicutes bacterium]|nr:pilus assembly protein N-terminal domain-containing protein [Negativicutes bacterium]
MNRRVVGNSKTGTTTVIMAALLVLLLVPAGLATAALPPVTDTAGDQLTVNLSQSVVVSFPGLKRVAVADPEVADVVAVGSAEVLVVGKQVGQTTIYLWGDQGRTGYLVSVVNGRSLNHDEIIALIGCDGVSVSGTGKTLVLDGTVPTQADRERAEKIASVYAEKVINLLDVSNPLQVRVAAQIVEIKRERLADLGLKWGSDLSKPGIFTFGEQAVSGSIITGKQSVWGHTALRGQLDLLIQTGAARLLSQPNITTLSGKEADIMVGGEIPVPVSQQNNTVTIEWKSYGISLKIKPVVGRAGNIETDVNAEVSAIDWNSNHVVKLGPDMEVPALTKRQSSAVINVVSGQTIAIGGLLSKTDAQAVQKIPLLGDIPVIGELFTSRSFERGETELIVLVTPTLVNSEQLPEQLPPSMAGQEGGLSGDQSGRQPADGR